MMLKKDIAESPTLVVTPKLWTQQRLLENEYKCV